MTAARACGTCNLCCKLVPVDALEKPANTWCQHAVKKAGCGIYADRPIGCRNWSCMWLGDPRATAALARPDHAKYVVDEGADVIKLNGEPLGVMQVWVDPGYPNAWRSDEALKALMLKMARAAKLGTIVRHGNDGAFVVLPPPVSPSGEWQTHWQDTNRPAMSREDKVAFFAERDRKEPLALPAAGKPTGQRAIVIVEKL